MGLNFMGSPVGSPNPPGPTPQPFPVYSNASQELTGRKRKLTRRHYHFPFANFPFLGSGPGLFPAWTSKHHRLFETFHRMDGQKIFISSARKRRQQKMVIYLFLQASFSSSCKFSTSHPVVFLWIFHN